jgi:hypothetical protein
VPFHNFVDFHFGLSQKAIAQCVYILPSNIA